MVSTPWDLLMPTKTWKTHERKVAQLAGGKRNGATGTNSADVSTDLLDIEVKHGKRIPKLVVDALAQAKRNAAPGRVPVVVLHPAHSSHYIAVLDLQDLLNLINKVDSVGTD